MEMIGRILNVSPPHWRNVLIGDDVNLDFKDIKRLKQVNILFIPSIQYKVTLNHNYSFCMSTNTACYFPFLWVTNWMMQYNQVDTFTMITFEDPKLIILPSDAQFQTSRYVIC